ncbi:MAG TPA: DUF4907 domain-containing protein [Parafilimonas sp.]|nr:DUF4907 domain-containing protein [Parafilimonas sp.]
MKAKNILMAGCMMIAIMLISCYHAQAQSMQPVKSPDITGREVAAGFTYKIFQAPNSMYGYDIFRNGKIIFHQGASSIKSNDFFIALSKKDQAEKAALLAMEKIKKNQPGTLTQEELKKIAAQ